MLRYGSLIELSEYDPVWPKQFERLRGALWPAVDGYAAGIEHVGSTSVPGLVAKPVIDIDIVMRRYVDFPAIARGLAVLGYEHDGDQGIEHREVFKGGHPDVRHHLYVCLEESAALRNHLTLREALRTDPVLLAEYAALKRRLAEGADKERYWRGKTEFVLRVLASQGFVSDELEAIRRAN